MKLANATRSIDGPVTGRSLPIASPEGIPGDEFLQELRSIVESRRLTNAGRVRELEEAASHYLGVPFCVAVSSCTAGLMLTLRVLQLHGEVILPSFTFHATAHSALWNGLKPVFADCNEETFCIDPNAVREKLSSATAAIVAVHLFGCPAPVSELEEISANARIPLVYDSAHAFGSKVGDRHVGTFGVAEVFSFSPTKLVVAGEGGLIATRDGVLAEHLRAARNYGDAGTGDPQVLGLNARMSEFHAALALSGFGSLEARIHRRNQIRLHYLRRLEAVPGLSFQRIPEAHRSTCKDMSVLVDEHVFGVSRDGLRNLLGEQNIEARRYFWPPVHQQKLYQRIWDRDPLPVTDRVSARVLNLPIYSALTDQDVDRVGDAILCASELAKHGKPPAKANANYRALASSTAMPTAAGGRRF